MAHRSRRQRDTSDPFNTSLEETLLSAPTVTQAINPYREIQRLTDLQDLRRFDPTDLEPQTLVGTQALFRPAPADTVTIQRMMESGRTPRTARNYYNQNFDDPRKALECARRKTRREVMFSKPERKRRGRGGSRRRDEWSNIHC